MANIDVLAIIAEAGKAAVNSLPAPKAHSLNARITGSPPAEGGLTVDGFNAAHIVGQMCADGDDYQTQVEALREHAESLPGGSAFNRCSIGFAQDGTPKITCLTCLAANGKTTPSTLKKDSRRHPLFYGFTKNHLRGSTHEKAVTKVSIEISAADSEDQHTLVLPFM